ncbi:MAG: UDP-2,4-diacetamido-2,4,6-trideoxy-beta-L-altropyranose hydrolase [Methanoregula sp.]|nr:UDP-2,4-diacetamido-2,4,6-trideoxy-beta-L-altropyranose hydrolase [Methanoregula sp.]
MRCLALAQAWQDNGGTVTFLMVPGSPSLEQRIRTEGMNVLTLTDHPGSKEDAATTVEYAKKIEASWVVVDGYQFDAEYQRLLKAHNCNILFIDDYGHAEHYYADIVLNQNIYAEMSFYKNHESYTKFLLGTKYALLRREFLIWAGYRRIIPPVARRILITFGGGDPNDLTGAVTKILRNAAIEDLEVIVVTGGIYSHFEGLQSIVADLHCFSIRKNVSNMPELIAWADVAITAGGSTCWELAFMGLPSLLYTSADNQARVVDALVAQEMAERLTSEDLFNPYAGLKKISELLSSEKTRQGQSRRMRALVDGEGASRVTMILKNESVRLRKVRENDSDLIYRWINEPEVRARSFRPHLITPKEHEAWFSSVLADKDLHYFIAIDEHDHPVGQARLRIEDDHAVISVLIESASRNKGLGSRVIGIATRILFARTPVREVHAFIKTGNESSIRAFTKAGYTYDERTSVENQEAYLMKQRRGDD